MVQHLAWYDITAVFQVSGCDDSRWLKTTTFATKGSLTHPAWRCFVLQIADALNRAVDNAERKHKLNVYVQV